MSESRRPLVAANWKMHKLIGEAGAFCERFVAGYRELAEPAPPPADAVIFPSHTLLPVVARALTGSPVAAGGQDLHPDDEGAHTGDVSGPQLVDAGAQWVLCGHSERRSDHGESDETVGRKVEAALRAGLTVILCLGERAEERKAERTFEVLERQLAAGLSAVGSKGGRGLTIAYEPVWAIGTGETATPEIAQEAHAFLRSRLAELLSAERSRSLRILYGGSVKPGNAAELIAQPDIDGFLVGGASLDPGKFLDIIRRCS